jgi:hypothetical protein
MFAPLAQGGRIFAWSVITMKATLVEVPLERWSW